MRVDLKKIEAIAKNSHSICRGTGIIGMRTVVGAKKGESNDMILCPCVYRALKKGGVNHRIVKEMQQAIGVDPPKEEARDGDELLHGKEVL